MRAFFDDRAEISDMLVQIFPNFVLLTWIIGVKKRLKIQNGIIAKCFVDWNYVIIRNNGLNEFEAP